MTLRLTVEQSNHGASKLSRVVSGRILAAPPPAHDGLLCSHMTTDAILF